MKTYAWQGAVGGRSCPHSQLLKGFSSPCLFERHTKVGKGLTQTLPKGTPRTSTGTTVKTSKYCKLSKAMYRKLQIHFKIRHTATTEIKRCFFFVRKVFFRSRNAVSQILNKTQVFHPFCHKPAPMCKEGGSSPSASRKAHTSESQLQARPVYKQRSSFVILECPFHQVELKSVAADHPCCSAQETFLLSITFPTGRRATESERESERESVADLSGAGIAS